MNDWTTSHDRVLAQRHADGWMFLIDAARDMWTTAVLARRDKALARLLTGPVRLQAPRSPLTVLHTGVNRSAVAHTLLAQLSDGSRLDITEAGPGALARLRGLVAAHLNPVDTSHHIQVRLHEADIEPFAATERYDVIVSELPLTRFSPLETERIMARYLELLRPGGTLAYSTGFDLHSLAGTLSSKGEMRRHADVNKIMTAYQRSYAIGRWTVWSGPFPTRIWHLQRPPVSSADLPAPRDRVGR